MKIQIKNGGSGRGGGRWGARVDGNEELKFFGENSQKEFRGGGGGRGMFELGCSGWGGGGSGWM